LLKLRATKFWRPFPEKFRSDPRENADPPRDAKSFLPPRELLLLLKLRDTKFERLDDPRLNPLPALPARAKLLGER
jgi:hypothetical protein